MRVDGPADVPDLRLHLREQWKDGRVFERMAAQFGMYNGSGRTVRGQERTSWTAFERRSIEAASLWWVAPDMCDLLAQATPSVPTATRVDGLPVPSTCGIVVFAQPMTGTDADPARQGAQVLVHAVLWGLAQLPGLEGRPELGPSVPCLSMSSYAAYDLDAGLTPEQLQRCAGLLAMQGRSTGTQHGVQWAPLGRSDWPLADPLGLPLVPSANPLTALSMAEDRRLIAALWTITSTETVAATEAAALGRPTRRRSERAGIDPDLIPTRIVTLRKLRRPDEEHVGTEGPGNWSCRWVVSGHWRNQRCGPGGSERRLTWVSPHTKGPDHLPLRQPRTVKAWVR